MCIWKVSEKDRLCRYCTYAGGCEARPVEGRAGIEADGARLVAAANNVCAGDVQKRSKKASAVWARNFVIYTLRQMKYSYRQITSVVGMQHSTLIYSVRNMENMLSSPAMYPAETEMWEKFNQIINS